MEGDELSGSFFLIPTGPESSPAALKKENITLKAEISLLKNRLEGTERVLKLRREQDVQLRDSIFQATREVSLFFPFRVPDGSFIFGHRHSGHWELQGFFLARLKLLISTI